MPQPGPPPALDRHGEGDRGHDEQQPEQDARHRSRRGDHRRHDGDERRGHGGADPHQEEHGDTRHSHWNPVLVHIRVHQSSTAIGIRDSKNPQGGHLALTPSTFAVLLNRVRTGALDL
ncbi:DUF397 domain-containing protein [Actinomadura sp. WMMA1423]|uniref:DUF397 domain-containing protein n=1 Tax=Actinomadura sp. WMMA1423 TaxID=2591108 RepID=UPI001F10BB95|nr:DUF397 domain-containing protein [Actinomadura sp. WMMA1423]